MAGEGCGCRGFAAEGAVGVGEPGAGMNTVGLASGRSVKVGAATVA